MYKPIFNLNIGSKLLIIQMRFLIWMHMLVYRSNIKLVTPKYAQHKKKVWNKLWHVWSFRKLVFDSFFERMIMKHYSWGLSVSTSKCQLYSCWNMQGKHVPQTFVTFNQITPWLVRLGITSSLKSLINKWIDAWLLLCLIMLSR